LLPILIAVVLATVDDGLPVRAPQEVGMSAERLAVIDRVVRRGVAAHGFPGASVVVGRRGAIVWQRGFGRFDWREDSRVVDPRTTMYDLASLTKVVATTTAIMILYDAGKLSLDDPVAKYLPAFTGGQKSRVTIRQLLMHRGGLPAGRDVWRRARSAREARSMMLATPLVSAPGSRQLYSDVGPDILGFVVEAVSKEPLDDFVTRHVFRRLGMRNTTFRPAASLRPRIPPTEVAPPRGYPLRGEVHDENAYVLGGVAGHAGLFSTAADLSIFAQMMLNGGEYNGVRIVSDSTVALFTRRAAGSRGLGWEMCEGAGSCGHNLSATAYGHTGFTGTSLWIDPEREMFVIMLTNWVHMDPRSVNDPFAVLPDVRADVVDVAALSIIDGPAGAPPMPVAFRADRALGWGLPHVGVRLPDA
jgi:CubicO group peptidase (beta-lactamase class C family)